MPTVENMVLCERWSWSTAHGLVDVVGAGIEHLYPTGFPVTIRFEVLTWTRADASEIGDTIKLRLELRHITKDSETVVDSATGEAKFPGDVDPNMMPPRFNGGPLGTVVERAGLYHVVALHNDEVLATRPIFVNPVGAKPVATDWDGPPPTA